QRDFAPVTGVAATQTVLVVHPSVPARSVKDLIALARSRPKALNYGSAGHGSISHMAVELFTYTTGAKFTHVPYKGEGQAAVDLMAGGVDFMFPNMPTVLGLVHAGKLRAVAVGGASRSQLLPELPTMAEAGAPGYEMSGWFGMFAAAGTSRDILTRLNGEVARGFQRDDIRDLLAGQGAEPMRGSVDEFSAFVRSELGKWAKVVSAAGVKVD
ncbi:MAG TPA: tripartite tricarboxylate transporter substrate-binding protein, partial [Burkholderiales bacterium]|nr:tripartite tricarboxylate transporter substrate-binding protein [Burkholderiales bacterium]